MKTSISISNSPPAYTLNIFLVISTNGVAIPDIQKRQVDSYYVFIQCKHNNVCNCREALFNFTDFNKFKFQYHQDKILNYDRAFWKDFLASTKKINLVRWAGIKCPLHYRKFSISFLHFQRNIIISFVNVWLNINVWILNTMRHVQLQNWRIPRVIFWLGSWYKPTYVIIS